VSLLDGGGLLFCKVGAIQGISCMMDGLFWLCNIESWGHFEVSCHVVGICLCGMRQMSSDR